MADAEKAAGQTPGASRLRQLLARSMTDLKLAADAARAERRFDLVLLIEGSKANVRSAVARLAEEASRDERSRT